MEKEFVLAKTRRVPQAVAVRSLSPGAFAVAWSADGNLFYGRLGAQRGLEAAPGPVGRIHPAAVSLAADERDVTGGKTFWPLEDRGSIDAGDIDLLVIDKKRCAIASLEPAKESRVGGVYLSLVFFAGVNDAVSDEAPQTRTLRLGPAGEFAHRISLARREASLYVAWHEGRMTRSDVVVSRVDLASLEVRETRRVFKEDGAIASPSLTSTDEGVFFSWTETGQTALAAKTQVYLAGLDGKLQLSRRRVVAETRFVDPAPELVAAGSQIGVVFRDDVDGDETPEFYFSLFDVRGEKARTTRRISQADGWRGPSVTLMPPHVVSAAVRSFQRNLLVGLNRFDLQGVKLGGEYQLYADKTDFVRVDVAAMGNRLLMVYAEDRQGAGRVLAGSVVCRNTSTSGPNFDPNIDDPPHR